MRIVFSGGGTGGHIFPAVAVADEIKKRYPEAQILFIGAMGKMEMEKVPKAGYQIKGLWISGFQRQLTFKNLLFPAKLIHSLFAAYGILKKFKPDVVAGFGGFASGASLYVASFMKIPTLIQEQNSYAGVTNKLLATKVDRICTAYPDMNKFFPKEKMKFTGNPVRQVLLDVLDKSMALKDLGISKGRSVVLISGGSLGARTLNMAMKDNAENIIGMSDVHFIWQCGSLYLEEYAKCLTAKLPNVSIMPFIQNMEMVYSAADIVIARAGALTVSELCVQGKVSILVPSPNVAEDHQTKNAMALVERKAAVMVKDEELSDMMCERITFLLENEGLRKELEVNIKSLAKPNAVQEIADELIRLVNE